MLKEPNKAEGEVLGRALGLTGQRIAILGIGKLTGLGIPVAKQLLGMGAKLTISRRDGAGLAEVHDLLASWAWSPDHLFSTTVDAADDASVTTLCGFAADKMGGIDSGVFLAGSVLEGANAAHGSDTTEVVSSRVLEQFNVDAVGGLRFATAIKPHLVMVAKADIRPRLVMIDSIGCGVHGSGPASASTGYNMAKAALRTLMFMLANDWGNWCAVNSVAPGVVITDLNRKRMSGDRGQAALGSTPQGRLGFTDDVVGPFMVALSPVLGAWVHGQVLTANGGQNITNPY